MVKGEKVEVGKTQQTFHIFAFFLLYKFIFRKIS